MPDSRWWKEKQDEFWEEARADSEKLKESANSPSRHDLLALASAFVSSDFKRCGNDDYRPKKGNHADSLSIRPQKGNWFRYSEEKGGGIVSFVMEFGNKTYQEALEYLEPEKYSHHQSVYTKENMYFWIEKKYGVRSQYFDYGNKPHECHSKLTAEEIASSKRSTELSYNPDEQEEREPFDYNSIIRERNQCETIAYLTAVRGLDGNLVAKLIQDEKLMTYHRQGRYEESGKTYTTATRFGFPMHDCEGNIVGMDCRQLYTKQDGTVFRGLEKGTDRRNGFVEFECGACDENAKLLIFEATLDALSYLEMYHDSLDNHRLVVTAGVNEECIKNVMTGYHIPPENVIICTDNDMAGNELYDKAVADLGVPTENRQVPPNGCKDWNSYLCQVKGISEEIKKNPDEILRNAFIENYRQNHRSYISPNGSRITHHTPAPSVSRFERTQQQLPPVNRENMQAVINVSEETLAMYREKMAEFSYRVEILQNLQNPEYRQALQTTYDEMILNRQNGAEPQLDSQTRQQLNTLYFLNEAEQNGGSVTTLIHETQNRIQAVTNRINDCTQQQEELQGMQERTMNIRHHTPVQEGRAG